MEDLLWEEAGYYGWFAEAYGWTYEKTRTENPQWYLDRLPGVHALTEEIKAERQREADAAAERQREMNKGW